MFLLFFHVKGNGTEQSSQALGVDWLTLYKRWVETAAGTSISSFIIRNRESFACLIFLNSLRENRNKTGLKNCIRRGLFLLHCLQGRGRAEGSAPSVLGEFWLCHLLKSWMKRWDMLIKFVSYWNLRETAMLVIGETIWKTGDPWNCGFIYHTYICPAHDGSITFPSSLLPYL